MKLPRVELKRLKTALILLVSAVAVLHIIFVGGSFLFGWPHNSGLTRWFNVDQEYNIPTTISALSLLSIAAVAFRLKLLAQTKQRHAWLLVTALFVYMAVDELLVLHERLSLPVREYLAIGWDSPFFHAWIIPAAIIGLLALFGIYHLSATINKVLRLRFIELLVLYALGVIVIEVIGTYLFDNQALYYTVIVLAEECFELALQSAILFALYRHLLSVAKDGSKFL